MLFMTTRIIAKETGLIGVAITQSMKTVPNNFYFIIPIVIFSTFSFLYELFLTKVEMFSHIFIKVSKFYRIFFYC
jgi:hypothetical protein